MRTVGVSIAVPEPYFTQLREMRRVAGDPMADAVPPHVTLLPPTDIAKVSVDEFVEYLREVAMRHDPFTMILRGTGTFRPISPVVFVQLAQGISSCELFEEDIRSGPVARDLEFGYHPHITIAHHVDDAQLDRAFDDNKDFEAIFEVTEFYLYFQDDDGNWAPVERFPLRRSSADHSASQTEAGN